MDRVVQKPWKAQSRYSQKDHFSVCLYSQQIKPEYAKQYVNAKVLQLVNLFRVNRLRNFRFEKENLCTCFFAHHLLIINDDFYSWTTLSVNSSCSVTDLMPQIAYAKQLILVCQNTSTTQRILTHGTFNFSDVIRLHTYNIVVTKCNYA